MALRFRCASKLRCKELRWIVLFLLQTFFAVLLRFRILLAFENYSSSMATTAAETAIIAVYLTYDTLECEWNFKEARVPFDASSALCAVVTVNFTNLVWLLFFPQFYNPKHFLLFHFILFRFISIGRTRVSCERQNNFRSVWITPLREIDRHKAYRRIRFAFRSCCETNGEKCLHERNSNKIHTKSTHTKNTIAKQAPNQNVEHDDEKFKHLLTEWQCAAFSHTPTSEPSFFWKIVYLCARGFIAHIFAVAATAAVVVVVVHKFVVGLDDGFFFCLSSSLLFLAFGAGTRILRHSRWWRQWWCWRMWSSYLFSPDFSICWLLTN